MVGGREIWAGSVGFLPVLFFCPLEKQEKKRKSRKQEALIFWIFLERHQKKVRNFGARMACSYFEKICEAELEVELFFLAKWIPLPLWTVRFFLKGNSGLLFTTQCLLEIVRSLSDI